MKRGEIRHLHFNIRVRSYAWLYDASLKDHVGRGEGHPFSYYVYSTYDGRSLLISPRILAGSIRMWTRRQDIKEENGISFSSPSLLCTCTGPPPPSPDPFPKNRALCFQLEKKRVRTTIRKCDSKTAYFTAAPTKHWGVEDATKCLCPTPLSLFEME